MAPEASRSSFLVGVVLVINFLPLVAMIGGFVLTLIWAFTSSDEEEPHDPFSEMSSGSLSKDIESSSSPAWGSRVSSTSTSAAGSVYTYSTNPLHSVNQSKAQSMLENKPKSTTATVTASSPPPDIGAYHAAIALAKGSEFNIRTSGPLTLDHSTGLNYPSNHLPPMANVIPMNVHSSCQNPPQCDRQYERYQRYMASFHASSPLLQPLCPTSQ